MSAIRSWLRYVCPMVLVLVPAGVIYAGGGKNAPKISTPTISCGGSSLLSNSTTQAPLNVTVTAGASGLPAGFSLQWMTAADFAAYGWPSDSECATGVC